LQRKKQDIS